MADDRAVKFDFLAGRNTVSTEISKLGAQSDGLGKKMLGFGKVAAVAMAGAGVAVIGLGIHAAKSGLQTAASMEQAQIAFTQLLGSSTKAKNYIADLSKFAANTPFDFPGLVDASRLLIGVGQSTKQTMQIMQDFGDTSGALGIKQDAFQRIMLATSQALSAGKFQAGDLNQIMTNGIPIWSILSEAMGKPVPVLRDLASKGQLLASDVMPALHAQMQKDYGGAMAKQSLTLSGLWSTLMDTINQGLGQVMMPLLPVIRDLMPGAIKVLGDAFSGLSGWMTSEGIPAFRGFVDWLERRFVPGVGDALKGIEKKLPHIDLSGMVSDFTGAATKWAGGIIDGVTTGVQTGDWTKLATAVTDAIGRASQGAQGGLSKIVEAFGEWARNYDWLGAGEFVGKQALPFLVGFISQLLDPATIYQSFRDHPMDWVVALTAFLGIGKAGGTIAKVLDKIPILEWFAPLFTKLESLTAPINNVLGKVFGFVGDHMGQAIKDVFPKLDGPMQQGLRSFADGVALKALYMAEAGTKFIGGLIEGATRKAIEIPISVGKFVYKELVDPFVQAGTWLVKAGVDLITGLIRGIGQVSLAPEMAKVVKMMVQPMAGDIGWLVNAGRNLIQGLINGILGMLPSLGGVLGNVGQFILDHKGPPEKDAVMLTPAGQSLMHGLIAGIESAKPALADSLGAIGPDYLGQGGPAGSSWSGTGGGTTVEHHWHFEGSAIGNEDYLQRVIRSVLAGSANRGYGITR